MKETETLDKLYLEWSQFTSARTAREIACEDALEEALNWLNMDKPDDARKVIIAVRYRYPRK